jgi:aldose sugar dehydrogenase
MMRAATLIAILTGIGTAFPVLPETIETSAGYVSVSAMATGLDEPWALAFLPDGSFLITERAGRLTLFPPEGGRGQPVGGLPEVYAEGQGGLLDVMVPRDFATSREVWLSYAEPQGGGAGTAAGRGWLSEDGTRLDTFEPLFQSPEGGQGGRHFGSRLVEAADGTVFLTIGERGTGPDGMEAQDGTRAEGKVIHLARDGSPATLQDGLLPGVYSMGHRNPQGAALDAAGQLWVTEHGAQGGDELNRILPGRNYGWPVISYGRDYDDSPIGIGTEAPGMEQPVHYWDPSIAPSGLMIYQGSLFPDWQGDIFTGSLKFGFLSRLDPETGYKEERIEGPETARTRDVREAPDGAIWFLSVGNGAAYRMVPAE